LGILLFVGCIIAGIGINITDADLEIFCNPSLKILVDDLCEQQQTIHNWVIATTVSSYLCMQGLNNSIKLTFVYIYMQVVNAVCTVLMLILFIWDYIYLCAGFNSRIPVPRGIKVQHQ